MANFTRNWWGKKFIEALEKFTDSARLGRGRGYARNGKIIEYNISKGKIVAKVKGSINPYFGVYKEPKYNTTIEIKTFSSKEWESIIKVLSSNAGFVSKLLVNEIPENIDNVFSSIGLNLLPERRSDFKTNCSCPDSSNPCKHIAGVYYLVASEFDRDPFLIFELRGLTKEDLHKKLADSTLGKLLLSELEVKNFIPKSEISYFTIPEKTKIESKSLRDFWLGNKRLPQHIEYISELPVDAVLIKKQGDYPPFWEKNASFIDSMEEVYIKIKQKI